ncbi:MAG: Crp/Fnr family transcriptional regulator [Myxococcaceae bacterium]|nr:Crp/Fnr family transcriptional regulator [Myxococcaceae bacterium]
MFEKPVESCAACPLHAGGRCVFVPRKVSAGERLWEQGEVPPEVAFVQSGTVALTATDAEGGHWWNGVRGPKSLLGVEAIQGRPARARAEVVTDASLCTVDPVALRLQVGADGSPPQYPELTSALVPLLLEELDRRSEETQGRSGTALARVARFILEHSEVVESGQRGPFSKRHVASMLGIRPETMSRCLAALTKDNVITVGRHISVNDRARLEAIASPPHVEVQPAPRRRRKTARGE